MSYFIPIENKLRFIKIEIYLEFISFLTIL